MDGRVTEDDVPVVLLPLAGGTWEACIDTGFNGDLELPEELRPFVNAKYLEQIHWVLAADQEIEQELYEVDFPFDGRLVRAEATFITGQQILIGTRLIKEYRLDVHFPKQHVSLERVAAS